MNHLHIAKKNKLIFPLLIDHFLYSVEIMHTDKRKGNEIYDGIYHILT